MRARLFSADDLRGSCPIVLDSFPIFLGIGEHARLQVSEEASDTFRCQIQLEQGTLVAIDLESAEGTLVNGESIERSPLMPGDRLRIGQSELTVSYERLTRRRPPEVLFRPLSINAVGGVFGT